MDISFHISTTVVEASGFRVGIVGLDLKQSALPDSEYLTLQSVHCSQFGTTWTFSSCCIPVCVVVSLETSGQPSNPRVFAINDYAWELVYTIWQSQTKWKPQIRLLSVHSLLLIDCLLLQFVRKIALTTYPLLFTHPGHIWAFLAMSSSHYRALYKCPITLLYCFWVILPTDKLTNQHTNRCKHISP